ncbi:MAG: hypothetical protein ABR985_17660 [Methanotrichaceae archaeon]
MLNEVKRDFVYFDYLLRSVMTPQTRATESTWQAGQGSRGGYQEGERGPQEIESKTGNRSSGWLEKRQKVIEVLKEREGDPKDPTPGREHNK